LARALRGASGPTDQSLSREAPCLFESDGAPARRMKAGTRGPAESREESTWRKAKETAFDIARLSKQHRFEPHTRQQFSGKSNTVRLGRARADHGNPIHPSRLSV